MTLMSRHHIDFVAFDFSRKRRRRLFGNDALTQLPGHLLNIVFVQVQFLSNLLIRQIQPHEIQTQNPRPQRLMMTREICPGQIVKPFATGLALITLPLRLRVVVSLLGDVPTATIRTRHPARPPKFANRLKALGVVDQILNVEHHPWPRWQKVHSIGTGDPSCAPIQILHTDNTLFRPTPRNPSRALANWRRLREQGSLQSLGPKKRGRKGKRKDATTKEVARRRRENQRLAERLRQAETIIEVQKEVSEIMGVTLINESQKSEEKP